jgi:hypothetical protein
VFTDFLHLQKKTGSKYLLTKTSRLTFQLCNLNTTKFSRASSAVITKLEFWFKNGASKHALIGRAESVLFEGTPVPVGAA